MNVLSGHMFFILQDGLGRE